MRPLTGPSTGSNLISYIVPAAVIRPAFCRTAAWYQREPCPLYGRLEGVADRDGPEPRRGDLRRPGTPLSERSSLGLLRAASGTRTLALRFTKAPLYRLS